MIIYAIRNDTNDKVYVGQTVKTAAARLAEHRRSNRDDMLIACAMRELGPSRFRVEVLEECGSQRDLNAAERRWIVALGSLDPAGYNVSLGTGRHEKTRARISAALRGRQVTWGDKISAARRGKPAMPGSLAALALGRRIPRSTEALGRNNRHRKLSDAEVIEIRRLCDGGCLSQEAIAERYDVKQVAVGRISRRVTYSWLPEED